MTEATLWEIEISPTMFNVKEITELPYARGSGGMAAKAMMKFVGLKACDAVVAAIDCDRYSGGPVTSISRDDTKIKTFEPTQETFELLKKSITFKPPKTKLPAKPTSKVNP